MLPPYSTGPDVKGGKRAGRRRSARPSTSPTHSIQEAPQQHIRSTTTHTYPTFTVIDTQQFCHIRRTTKESSSTIVIT